MENEKAMNLLEYYKRKDIQSCDKTESMYHYLCMINTIELMSNRKFCIFDIIHSEVLCSSTFDAFWMELTNGKSKCCNSGFYDSVVLEEDKEMLERVNKKWFDFLYLLPAERRQYGYITCDFRIKMRDGSMPILINQKLTPLELTLDGQIRFIMCIMSNSVNKTSGNIYIKMCDTSQVYEFNPGKDKFVEIKGQQLTKRGHEVLELSSKGKTDTQIAVKLGISIDTVKSHKRKIFESLGVTNIKEAIQWLNNQKCLHKNHVNT